MHNGGRWYGDAASALMKNLNMERPVCPLLNLVPTYLRNVEDFLAQYNVGGGGGTVHPGYYLR